MKKLQSKISQVLLVSAIVTPLLFGCTSENDDEIFNNTKSQLDNTYETDEEDEKKQKPDSLS